MSIGFEFERKKRGKMWQKLPPSSSARQRVELLQQQQLSSAHSFLSGRLSAENGSENDIVKITPSSCVVIDHVQGRKKHKPCLAGSTTTTVAVVVCCLRVLSDFKSFSDDVNVAILSEL